MEILTKDELVQLAAQAQEQKALEEMKRKKYELEICPPEKMETKFVLKGKENHTVSVKILTDSIHKGNFSIQCGDTGDDLCEVGFTPIRTIIINGDKKIDVCQHIIMALGSIGPEKLNNILDDLLSANNIKARRLTEYEDLFKLAFKVPILIEGHRGAGKTYGAFAFSEDLGIKPIVINGHADLESIDLLGYYIKHNLTQNADGQPINWANPTVSTSTVSDLVWKDGPLTEAFRKAEKGEKVIIIFDELLRVPQKQLNLLLSALSPYKGEYHLRTSHVVSITDDGVALEEELTVPADNICFIGTTNVGDEYAVDDLDPALAERFIILRKDTDKGTLTRILTKKIEEKHFSSKLLGKLTEFWAICENLKRQDLLAHAPTVRTLSRAIDLANDEASVKEMVAMQALLWVGRDQDGIDQVQMESFKKALESAWKK